jgi:F420H(2)-dependent biliverdin reductase
MRQELSDEAIEFVTERHLATLSTLRADGSPHVVPVGFTFDADNGTARVITFAGSAKVTNAASGGRAAVCQVDGARWITFEGTSRTSTEPDVVNAAVEAYTRRYRQPKQRPDRVVIEINVDKVLCSKGMKQ